MNRGVVLKPGEETPILTGRLTAAADFVFRRFPGPWEIFFQHWAEIVFRIGFPTTVETSFRATGSLRRDVSWGLQVDFALKLTGDMQAWFTEHEIRRFYSLSISSYHMAKLEPRRSRSSPSPWPTGDLPP